MRLTTRFLAQLGLAWLITLGAASAIGDELNLTAHRGKVIIVDYWASWCAPCRQSFPWLNELQAKYGDRGLVVIGVNVDRDRQEAERFLRETPAQFQIVYDPTGALAKRQGVMGMPSSYLYGPDGVLVGEHIGFKKADRLAREAELVRLLDRRAGTTAGSRAERGAQR